MSDSRIAQLEAEIARLRAVCDEHDVDPDWEPVRARFGPPTAREAHIEAVINQTLRLPAMRESLARSNSVMDLLDRNQRGAAWRWVNAPKITTP